MKFRIKKKSVVIAAAVLAAVIFCGSYIVTQSAQGFCGDTVTWEKTGGEKTTGIEKSTESEENSDGEEDSVSEENADSEENESTGRRAYLTFDDGPSDNTEEILDILDENGVKATFFVVGRDEKYYDIYRDIVQRGHTLGLHSYSHDYDKIYAGLTDFAEDVEELRKLLYDVTGVDCVYYRFPGGSSNTVSSVDMDTLISYIEAQGLVYFDWNALNGDAVSDSYTPEQLVQNVMEDALLHDDAVILMHDLNARHTTVESLQMLIDRLEEEGYELLPIDEDTPLIRHTH